jgi:hypothetical protein
MARDQMKWYVNKGQDIDILQPVRFTFTQPYIDPPENNIYEVEIWQCETDPCPPRLTPDVTVLCQISCRLDVRFEDLPQRLDTTGYPFREFVYEIEMVREDAGLQFFLVYNGQRIGSQDIKVQIDPDPHTMAQRGR